MATFALVSPGSEPVRVGRKRDAERNVRALIKDTGLDGVEYSFDDFHEASGRYAFTLKRGKKVVDCLMPGLPPEKVRYYGRSDQDLLQFPRLYVNGSSWLWQFAIGIVQDALGDHPRP